MKRSNQDGKLEITNSSNSKSDDNYLPGEKSAATGQDYYFGGPPVKDQPPSEPPEIDELIGSLYSSSISSDLKPLDENAWNDNLPADVVVEKVIAAKASLPEKPALYIDGLARLSLSQDVEFSPHVKQNEVINKAQKLYAIFPNYFANGSENRQTSPRVKLPIPIRVHKNIFNKGNRIHLPNFQEHSYLLTLHAILIDYISNEPAPLCKACEIKQQMDSKKFRQINVNGAITKGNNIVVNDITINCAGEHKDGTFCVVFFLQYGIMDDNNMNQLPIVKESFQYITVPFHFIHKREKKKVCVPPPDSLLTKAVFLSTVNPNRLNSVDPKFLNLIKIVNESFMVIKDPKTMLNYFHANSVSIDMKHRLTTPLFPNFYVVCQVASNSLEGLKFTYHELKVEGDLDFGVINIRYSYSGQWKHPMDDQKPGSNTDVVVSMCSGAIFRNSKVEKVWGNINCPNNEWNLALYNVALNLEKRKKSVQ